MLYMYLVLRDTDSNLREKHIALSTVQHVEIKVEKLVKVMQSENGGAGSRPDTLNGGTMPLCTIGYVL